MQTAPPTTTAVPPSPRITKTGVVVSDKRSKTRTVAVAYQRRHPKYGKYFQRTTKYHVHDPANASKEGDRVQITMCRPISKTKAWRLVRVVGSEATEPSPVSPEGTNL